MNQRNELLARNKRENYLITGVHMTYWPAFTILSTFLITFWTGIGFNVEQIGLIVTIQSLVNLFAQPIWGILTDTKLTIRKAILLCSIVAIPLPFLHLFTTIFWHVVLLNAIFAAFAQPIAGLVDAWTYKLASGNPNIVYGFSRGMGSLLSAVVSLLAGVILNEFGINLVFPFYAALILLVFLFSFAIKDEEMLHKSQAKDALSFSSAVKILLTNPRYLVFVLSMTLMNIGLRAALTFTPILISRLGGTNFHNGLSMAVNTSMMLPFMLLYTKLSERYKNKTLMLWAGAFTILRILSLGVASGLFSVITFQLLNSASYGFLQPAMLEYVRRHTPLAIHSTAITFITAVIAAISGILGNYVSGAMIASIGISYTFLLLAGVAGFGVLLFVIGDVLPGYDRDEDVLPVETSVNGT